jgi:hypothetical protein
MKMELQNTETRLLVRSAILHDIGKIEPEKEGFENFRRHVIMGEGLLSSVSVLAPLSHIVRSHHERWDGTGYPDRLKEAEIPLGSRIVAICDHIANFTNQGRNNDTKSLVRSLFDLSGFAVDPNLLNIIVRDLDQSISGLDDGFDKIHPIDLEEGMITSEDLYTSHGVFLIPGGTVLDKKTINRIQSFHRIAPIIGGVRVLRSMDDEKEKGKRSI